MNTSTQNQADGYVTEIPYVAGYQRGLNPVLQAFTLNVYGIGTWQTGTPMTYLELGCGFGLSTLAHAAANPQATFIGIDILPEHITTARGLAEAAGLTNVQFVEGSFSQLSDLNLPACDFIAMHGVWSWINAENRAHIVKCVEAKLKPGGVLYVSYNALPGSAAVLPVRQLMMAEFARAQGTVTERIFAAIALADSVKAIGGGFFADNPLAVHRFEEMKTQPSNYLAHEYFNADWQAFYFKDVASTFAAAGLRFACQADLFMTVDSFHFMPSTRVELQRIQDPALREVFRDFAIDRQFRADLYVRPANTSPPGAQQLSTTPFFAAVPPQRIDAIEVKTAFGKVAPPHNEGMAVLEALWNRPLTVRELARNAAFTGMPPQNLMNLLIFSVAAFAAAEPAFSSDGETARIDSTQRFNRAIWEKNVDQFWTEANASPVTGGAIEVSREDQMYLLARARGIDPIGFAAKTLNAPETDIRTSYQGFEADRLPAYQRFGVGL